MFLLSFYTFYGYVYNSILFWIKCVQFVFTLQGWTQDNLNFSSSPIEVLIALMSGWFLYFSIALAFIFSLEHSIISLHSKENSTCYYWYQRVPATTVITVKVKNKIHTASKFNVNGDFDTSEKQKIAGKTITKNKLNLPMPLVLPKH